MIPVIRIQFEGRVLGVLDRVARKEPVEDAQLELKAGWIDPVKAARQLAGHANAASGAPIVWIIGVDEKDSRIVGAPRTELASWFHQVEKEFDELSPALLEQLVIPNPYGPSVVAMLFDTSRAPYAVKVPQPPRTGYGRTEVEFPWRDATRTRSARRSELLTVLAGNRLVPDVEELEAWLGVQEEILSVDGQPIEVVTWDFVGAAYFTPRDDRPVTMPYHQCRAVAEFDSGAQVPFGEVRLAPEIIATPYVYSTNAATPSIQAPPLKKESEAFLPSPSKLLLTGRVMIEDNPIPEGSVRVRADLGVAGARGLLSLAWNLTPTDSKSPYLNEWIGERRG